MKLLMDNLDLVLAVVALLQASAAAAHKYAPDSALDHVLGAVSRMLPGDLRGILGKGQAA